MDFSARDFTPQEQIELLQRWVLVHSYLYYQMDISLVTDYRYDSNSRQLFELRCKYPQDWDHSRYQYAMHDFEGSTGFGMVERLMEKERKSVMGDIGRLSANHVFKRRRRVV